MSIALGPPAPPPRLAAIVASGVLCALSAMLVVRVFHRPVVAWVVLAAAAHVAIAMVGRWSWRARVPAHAAATLGAVLVVGWLAGGRFPSGVAAGMWRGWSYSISTDWPSPLRAEPLVFVALVISLAATASTEVARSPRWRALLLLPALVLGLVLTALAAEAGPPPAALVGAWVLVAAAGLALAGQEVTRPTGRAQLRSGAPALVALAVLAAAGSAVVALAPGTARVDPRRAVLNPLVRSDEINPLTQVVAERALVPVEDRFHVGGEVAAGRWRTGVVDTYDGISWGSDLAVRPISPAQIAAAPGRPVEHQWIVARGSALRRVPLAGIPLSTDRAVGSDPDRSVLVLDQPVAAGDAVSVAVAAPWTPDEVPDDATSRPQHDEQSAALAPLAAKLAGGTPAPLIERLRRVEAAFRTEFVLDPDAPAGLNVGLLSFAVGNAGRATEEQYVAAFALIARTLGASSRIAIGYRVDSGGRAGVDVTSSEASAWPEVWFDGPGWVAFDPVPKARGGLPAATAATVGVAPAAIPPQAATESPERGADLSTVPAPVLRERSWVISAVIAVVGGAAAVSVAGGTAVVTVLAVKRRRRRRRLAAGEPYEQVLGVWAEATDHLLDLGARVHPSDTNGEIVAAALGVLEPDAVVPLRALATLANSAAHGAHPPDPVVAAHAVRLLGRLEQLCAEGRGPVRRLRIGCSIRSLRPAPRTFG